MAQVSLMCSTMSHGTLVGHKLFPVKDHHLVMGHLCLSLESNGPKLAMDIGFSTDDLILEKT